VIFPTALDSLVNGAKQLTSLRFFSRGEPLRSAWQVIGWWEARRVPYNLIVGATGVVTCAIILVTSLVAETYLGEPIGMPDPPIFAVFAVLFYAIMANLCFTGGWVVEIVVTRVWGEEAQSFGPISFTLGLVFSVALTLAPAILVVGAMVLRMAFHVASTALR